MKTARADYGVAILARVGEWHPTLKEQRADRDHAIALLGMAPETADRYAASSGEIHAWASERWEQLMSRIPEVW